LNGGVAGVAIATVVSRLTNLLIVSISGHVLVHAKDHPERIANKEVFAKIIKIGLPSAAESMLYNIAMTLTIRFLNQMDPEGINVTARSYATQIANFSYCIGAALASANAIMTGWFIGAKEYDKCDRQTKKAALIGVAVGASVEALLALSAPVTVGWFTNDLEMIKLVQTLLTIDIALECGRVTNLIFVQSLKTSGDALFTTIMGVIFMFLCMVGGTWFFGIHLGMMAVGAYIGMALDECVRAVCMFFRWQSGKWRGKGLVHNG
ncbi:MAG: MATE family efflux transporter, partial [Lachnospiraceae bacterium]|nr:MATE family efflux transporter [Lachnospiraceae bacterium]